MRNGEMAVARDTTTMSHYAGSRPGDVIGVGYKSRHFADAVAASPPVSMLEVHTENYLVDGGARLHELETLSASYALSFHGVGLSLGGTDPLNGELLRGTRKLIERFSPAFVSEHLAWSSSDGIYFADLLPVALSAATLKACVSRLDHVQCALGRQILVENPTHYLHLHDHALDETQFLTELAERSGCALLVDVNNVYVSACNLGLSAKEYIDTIPARLVGEIHLAGHAISHIGDDVVLIDDHGSAVAEEVWSLYRRLIHRIGARPTVIEWDTRVPTWDVLCEEAQKAASELASIDPASRVASTQ